MPKPLLEAKTAHAQKARLTQPCNHTYLQYAAPRLWSGQRLLNPHRRLGLLCLKCGDKPTLWATDAIESEGVG